MYAAGTDSDMILWMGVAFHAIAHLMRAFVHVNRDELREVVKAIDVVGGKEASNEEGRDRSITTTITTTTVAAASTAVSAKKQKPTPLTM
jgi:hypothetical protein